MNLDHLSASSARLFLECPAKWRHHYVDGGKRDGNRAANNGSAIHDALETFIKGGHHISSVGNDPHVQKLNLVGFYQAAFDRLFAGKIDHTHEEERKQAKKMLEAWVDRNQDWRDRQVLSAEEAEEFQLDTKYGPVRFEYRLDRTDERLSDGRIIVTDYKSGRWAMAADDLKHDIQIRAYAVAAWKKYPGRGRYTVNLDYLYSGREIGVIFTEHEIEQIYQQLCELAEQILESDGKEERINSMCRFCPRLHECSAIRRPLHTTAVSLMEKRELVDERIRAYNQMTALKTWMAELDAALEPILKDPSEPLILRGSEDEGLTLKAGRGQRRVNGDELLDALPVEEIVKLGGTVTMSVGILEALIKSEGDPDKKARLSRAMGYTNARPSITVVSTKNLPEED